MDVKVSKHGAIYFLLVVILSLLFIMACSSTHTQMPQYLENAYSAVNRADIEKAEDFAPEDYDLAEDKLTVAKDMHILEDRHPQEENYLQDPMFLAQEAAIDARVAAAKAESVQLDSEIRSLRNETDQLRQEIDQY